MLGGWDEKKYPADSQGARDALGGCNPSGREFHPPDVTPFLLMCQRSKVVRHAPYGMLKSNEVPDQPWKSIAMDFITDLPDSDGYDTILVVIDRLTKMSHFNPCRKDLDARQFATLFSKEIIRLHGIPREIITDRGSLFTSELWKHATEKLAIERRLSTAFHPQTDGQTERTNGILEQYLRASIN